MVRGRGLLALEDNTIDLALDLIARTLTAERFRNCSARLGADVRALLTVSGRSVPSRSHGYTAAPITGISPICSVSLM